MLVWLNVCRDLYGVSVSAAESREEVEVLSLRGIFFREEDVHCTYVGITMNRNDLLLPLICCDEKAYAKRNQRVNNSERKAVFQSRFNSFFQLSSFIKDQINAKRSSPIQASHYPLS